MGASDLRVCVTSGYRIAAEGTTGGGNYEAEAIVYGAGGFTHARFTLCAKNRTHEQLRAVVRAKAEAWIAANPELRCEMVRRDATLGGNKSKFWRAHGVPV